MVDTIWQDLRYAARSLRRTPTFTAAAVITLALGIGATAAIFSLVNATLLKPLPYPESDRLFQLTRAGSTFQMGRVFLSVRERSQLFESIAAQGIGIGWNLVRGNEAMYVRGLRVSEGFFDLHRVMPLAGRGFTPDEDQPNGPNAAVVSEGLWRRVWDGSPEAIGQPIQLGGIPHLVVGVMPASFRSIPDADVWTPLRVPPGNNAANYEVIGRLREGRSEDEAAAELKVYRDEIVRDLPPERAATVPEFAWTPYRRALGAPFRDEMLLVFGAVLFLLAIACVNVASLQLTRTVERRRDVATRSALGASRARLARYVLSESLLIAVAGGILGLAIAASAPRMLLSLVSGELAAELLAGETVTTDWRVLLVLAAVTLASAVVFALAPAIASIRADLRPALPGTQASPGRGATWFRRSMVVAELALGLVLLVGAGLLVRSFLNLRSVEIGFNPTGVVVAKTALQGSRSQDPQDIQTMLERVLPRLRTAPGVIGAAAGSSVPVEGTLNLAIAAPEGADIQEARAVNWAYVTEGYFDVLGVSLRAGRTIDERDGATAPAVAVVNEAFARAYFPDETVVGRTIQLVPAYPDALRQIIGVVADAKARPNTNWSTGFNALSAGATPAVFIPARQLPAAVARVAHSFFHLNWIVRADAPPETVQRELQNALLASDPLLPFVRVETMDAIVARDLDFQRLMTALVAAFSALALALAAVGLYGVMAYASSQRAREVGIRMALGATAARVVRHFMSEGFGMTVLGIALGIGGAVLVTRLLAARLFGVTPLDAGTFASVAALLALVAAVATAIPAVRAARINPVTALRAE